MYQMGRKPRGFNMTNRRLNVTIDPEVIAVFDREKGLAKNSTYASYIIRKHFERRGLLPVKENVRHAFHP